MVSTSAACRPSDPERKNNLKQPELERAVKDCDFSYSSDLECKSENKSDTSDGFKCCDNSGRQRDGVRDVGPKRHDFTATSIGPKINLTVENTPKDDFKLFLTENLVQGFVDETNMYANNSIVSKQLSPRSIWSTWKNMTVTEFWCFLASYYKYGHIWALKYERLLESGMVISCSIFQLHILKRQIYANILDASALPHTTNYKTTNKDKNIAL
jgi:hypothetical protein